MRGAELAASARRRTLVLVNLASVLEKADEVLLPAVYREVGAALGASPTALGSLLPARRLRLRPPRPRPRRRRRRLPLGRPHLPRRHFRHLPPDGDFAGAERHRPGAGHPGDQLARRRLHRRPYPGRGVRVAADDHQSRLHRGRLLRGAAGPFTFLGVPGWRLAFHIVGIISVALGVLMSFFAADPCAKSKTSASAAEEAEELLRDARGVVAVPTFQVIVAQGITGLISWSALNFSTVCLELVGFTHWETSVITGLYLFATALGALFGGFIGDTISTRFPNGGKIALAQISSASAVPLGAILLLGLPNDPSTGVAHAVVFFMMGFFISWNAASTNNPIFAEIVP